MTTSKTIHYMKSLSALLWKFLDTSTTTQCCNRTNLDSISYNEFGIDDVGRRVGKVSRVIMEKVL